MSFNEAYQKCQGDRVNEVYPHMESKLTFIGKNKNEECSCIELTFDCYDLTDAKYFWERFTKDVYLENLLEMKQSKIGERFMNDDDKEYLKTRTLAPEYDSYKDFEGIRLHLFVREDKTLSKAFICTLTKSDSLYNEGESYQCVIGGDELFFDMLIEHNFDKE